MYIKLLFGIYQNAKISFFRSKSDKTHKDMQERITSNFKKCLNLADRCDDLKGFQDLMNSKIEKISMQMLKFKEIFNEKVSSLSNHFDIKIKAINEEIEVEVNEFNTQIESTKKLCKELINLNKESIESHVETQTENMKDHLGRAKINLIFIYV